MTLTRLGVGTAWMVADRLEEGIDQRDSRERVMGGNPRLRLDDGSKRALVPIENERNFLDVERQHGARRPHLLQDPEWQR